MEHFRFFFFLPLIIAFATYAQTAQHEQSFIFSDEFNNTQELIIGYDPFGTNGLDPDLGEIIIPQVPPGDFGVRFQLPIDTSITTLKDIRYGCGQPFYYKHLIDLSYINGSTSIEINWNWTWPTWYLYFINPFGGDTLAILENNWDPPHFTIPPSLGKIRIDVFYDGPLSWPEYRLYSPNGGELIQAGETYEISWWNNQLAPWMDIEFSSNAGVSWEYIAQNIPTTQNNFNWSVPSINSDHCLIRIGEYPCAYYISEGTFVIYENFPPSLNPVEIPFWLKNSVGDTINLIPGMHPTATNSLDTLLGEKSIQFPPIGNFAGAMVINSSLLSIKDYRPGYSTYIGNKIYYFQIQPNIDSLVTFCMNAPDGVIPSLFIVQKVPNGIGFTDTTFFTNEISYHFPEHTFYGGYSIWPGIQLTLNFDGTIPVELITFTISVSGNDVHLNWSTATETNNNGFKILRFAQNDDNTWQKIGFVPGHGTTTEQHHYSFIDESVSSGKYQYMLKQIDYDGSFEYSEIVEVVVRIPVKFSLGQNYPNPFNPTTKIKFTIPTVERFAESLKNNNERIGNSLYNVTLKVYDVLGNEIETLVNEEKPAGTYEVEFNADGLPSGIYFYIMRTGSFEKTKKMIFLK